MKLVAEADFLSWAAQRGLVLDSRYPQSAILTFGETPHESRFWCVPSKPERRSHFLASFLELLGDWNFCFAWRHLGSWPALADIDPGRINDVVEYHLLSGLGLPMGTGDIAEFARDEFGSLVSLLFVTTVFGWSVGEDLYIVPEHARYVLKTDHHDVIRVLFRNAADVTIFVEQMNERGFALPDELPDETFKRPAWMPTNDR